MGCAAGLVARGEGGEAREVLLGKEERVEPVDSAFVAVGVLVVGLKVWRLKVRRLKGNQNVRFPQVVQGGYPFRGELVDVLEYHVWV